jgi:hypothetical protein
VRRALILAHWTLTLRGTGVRDSAPLSAQRPHDPRVSPSHATHSFALRLPSRLISRAARPRWALHRTGLTPHAGSPGRGSSMHRVPCA